MLTWQERAEQLKPTPDSTMGWMDVAKVLKAEYGFSEHIERVAERVRSYLRRYYNRAEIVEKPKPKGGLSDLLKTGAKLADIADNLGVSERVAQAHIDDLMDEGQCIECIDDKYKMTRIPVSDAKTFVSKWDGAKIVRFGLLGDKHFGSKFTQIGYMHKAYDIFASEGIKDVYDTGDITEGENMRPGHAYECYVHGADDYVDEVCKNHPQRDGMTTHFVIGNHDLSFVKHVGLNIGKQIANNRKDMNYLGISQAFIQLTPNCKLELRHPGGGSAYAISYKPQKMVDAMQGGEKPNILALGHYHKAEYMFYRNIHIFQTGTLQAQSNFMRDNSLAAHMGAWIVTAHVNGDGEIVRIVPELIPFYKAVTDDWKRWR